MPMIRPSTDIRNDYNGISQFCHMHGEPVFITKNGKGDLAVLPIEGYERLVGKAELRALLAEGALAVEQKDYRPAGDVFEDLKARYEK